MIPPALPRYARPLYFVLVAIILVIAIVPQAQAPLGTPSDKVNHIIAFFTLAFLAKLLWPEKRIWVKALWLAAFGALIEVLQGVMAVGRNADWLDFVADVVAALAGLFAARAVLAFRRHARG